MARVEDSLWAIPVAQIASRAGQSKEIDADFPAPSGIGDDIVGIKEGDPVHVTGSFDSIVDGLIFTGRLVAPFVSECTRCCKSGSKNGKDEEVDIIAGEDESEDTYPLLENGAFADIEAMIRDTLVESLPLQPLCKPDCKGLCSQCGIDLNENPDHHHEMEDIRFAGLAGLKAQLEAEQGE
ncbi:MAG: YceD family protein [Bifidobacterium breve]|nr:YceD family protein [Bifidobacterium breve]